jgi:hypothetical protein
MQTPSVTIITATYNRSSAHLNRTVRPFDVSPSMDRRWLGVAVNWIELARLPR